MKSVIRTGKTVDEAVSQALEVLNTTKEKAKIEILEEPKSGLFGFIGSKDAVVRVSIPEEKSEVSEIIEEVFSNGTKEKAKEISEPVAEKVQEVEEKTEEFHQEKIEKVASESDEEIAVNLLNDILSGMDIKADLDVVKTESGIEIEIKNADDRDIGIIIGRRGETLDAIQYLVNLAQNKSVEEYTRVVIDINSYRKKREESLIRLAQKTAERAKRYKRNMRLEPMNPYERRIIHSALQKVNGVSTMSEGEEPYRRVIIKFNRK
ncbi:RNA-binding cell elongation regulator Jag/EloR [Microaceticoccus formicicus]|uniref:RNA-binding cell elongation regulator Jag/EloR n=1 Tax=Microaceticoccus formicicus TaxID=3118105 RepID=UPI003CD000F6|nr:RNA-binding cell elongation regulator Jag/EloR [Peptoniphilaceae bacterium AMB_02]